MPVCDFNPASEEYGDFIIHHNNSSPEDIILQQQAGCIDYVDQEFAIVYSLLEPLLPITTKKYTYTAIPTLYTLLDMQPDLMHQGAMLGGLLAESLKQGIFFHRRFQCSGKKIQGFRGSRNRLAAPGLDFSESAYFR